MQREAIDAEAQPAFGQWDFLSISKSGTDLGEIVSGIWAEGDFPCNRCHGPDTDRFGILEDGKRSMIGILS